MTRRKLTDETDDLTAFLGFFFENFMTDGASVPSEVHPLNFLREMAVRAPKRALLGLRMAIGDCIESSAHWSTQEVKEADDALRARAIPTLSEMRRRYYRRFIRILECGKIATEEEYYLVKVIAGGSFPPSDQALVLEKLLSEYENGAKPR
jgi:hypothetical protein